MKKVNKISIFGHSLGETDHTYFINSFSEFSHYDSNGPSKEIKIYHYGKQSYVDIHIQLDMLTRNSLTGFRQNNNIIYVDTEQ